LNSLNIWPLPRYLPAFRKFPPKIDIMRRFLFFLILATSFQSKAQDWLTPFEKSNGTESATYFESIDFYKKLDQHSTKISIKEMGMSDAGYPYQLVLYSNDGRFDPDQWHRDQKVVILIINGIHPGEPDGIDASMLMIRDLYKGSLHLPNNIALAVIPVYNIGGALNRNSFSRANQNGPKSYGFRGNSQNLDLNRDFTKSDSREARSFAQIFHWLNPDIQIDNHVSDGADYQHTMTLLSAQWNKLGGAVGQFLHDSFEPGIYQSMEKQGWPVCPYVNFEEGDPAKGWIAFYDPPRFSSGYASLFHTIAFIPETHMLKPFKDRVLSTYALMRSIIEQASEKAKEIIENRKKDFIEDKQKKEFALSWKPDTSRHDLIQFKGYEPAFKISEVTGQQRLYYDHNKPFEKEVKFFDYFKADKWIVAPKFYIIPQGWHEVLDLLKLNQVQMKKLSADSMITVQVYHIDEYRSSPRPYEKHHRNSDLKTSTAMASLRFLKGDYIIATDQAAKRFLVEMLEPGGDDSYFSWNFFDAILQEKEGYSDYRWEDLAASYLNEHPELKAKLQEKKNNDSSFQKNAAAQLNFVYKNSPYYEPAHLRYPVYRVLASD
jgi:Zinc carboxypeptidase